VKQDILTICITPPFLLSTVSNITVNRRRRRKKITSTYSRCINMAQWHQCVEKIREKMRNIF